MTKNEAVKDLLKRIMDELQKVDREKQTGWYKGPPPRQEWPEGEPSAETWEAVRDIWKLHKDVESGVLYEEDILKALNERKTT